MVVILHYLYLLLLTTKKIQLLTCVVFNATGAWPSMTSLYSLGLGAPKLTMLEYESMWEIRGAWQRVCDKG